jgi:hypothetical protein
MIPFIISVIVIGATYWFFILRPGRLDFWRCVAKHPDAAYDHFKAHSCWRVFENELPKNYREILPRSEWAGPFRLTVPKLGGQLVRVFGRRADCSRSQDAFLERFRRGT